jgi:hypothetical protein
VTQIESIIEPNGVGNDIWRDIYGACKYSFADSINFGPLTCQYPHKPFYPTTVKYVRFVGCNWSFYPGVGPIHFLDRAIISARKIRGDSIKGHPLTMFGSAPRIAAPLQLGRGGATPVAITDRKVVDINQYQLQRHCRGLFELPEAA